MQRIVPFLVSLVIILFPSVSSGWEGTVVRVSDGDTLTVERVLEDGGTERVCVRLYGIDTPENKGRKWGPQPYWKAAREFLADMVASGRVTVMDMGYDKYSRTIGAVITQPEGKVVQEEMLRAGFAWIYGKYCRDCRQWKSLEQEAREAKRGLWRETSPVPPWEWRKGKRSPSP